MTQIKAYVPGIYARSEKLAQATRDLDRNRTTEGAVRDLRDADYRTLLEVQAESGMDYLTDGLLGWQDMLRPFLQNTIGVSPGALTRYLETNTFFRAPLGQGGLERAEPLGEEHFRLAALSSSEEWVATLPSPLSLASEEITALDVAEEILLPQVEWLAERCCSIIVLHEPNLFGADAPEKLESLAEALKPLAEVDVPLALWLPFGDAAPVLGDLATLEGVSAVGVDFYSTSLEGFPEHFPKSLLAGVVDARNSLLEDPVKVLKFVRSVEDRVAGQVHIVPNGDLQFVPELVAREKVGVLGETADILKEGATRA